MSSFSLSLNHHLDLPDDVFRLMRDQIYKRTGMWFNDSSKYLLQKRLSPRAKELNFDSFQKYFYFLQYDPRAESEFDQIYDLVTTNETYFFREPAQLAAFVEEIVPDILARIVARKQWERTQSRATLPDLEQRAATLAPTRRDFRAIVLETLRDLSGSDEEFRAEALALLGWREAE